MRLTARGFFGKPFSAGERAFFPPPPGAHPLPFPQPAQGGGAFHPQGPASSQNLAFSSNFLLFSQASCRVLARL